MAMTGCKARPASETNDLKRMDKAEEETSPEEAEKDFEECMYAEEWMQRTTIQAVWVRSPRMNMAGHPRTVSGSSAEEA